MDESQIATLIEAARAGEVTAFVPLADAMLDAGHPNAEEMSELAQMIATEEDWAVVMYAIAVYLKLLDNGVKA